MNQRKRRYASLVVAGAVLFRASVSWAVTPSTMPWETPLLALWASFNGPVAMAISLLGVAVAGGMLIFGGELGEFTRRAVMLVLVVTLLTSAAGVMTTLFGSSGSWVS